MSGFWQDRPTFVTGGFGFLGGWVVARLVAQGAQVVCLRRDHEPHSELVRSGLINYVTVVEGSVEDALLLERTLGEYEIDVVLHLAAQTIVGIANRDPRSTFEVNIRGTWNMLEAVRGAATVKGVVVASSDKAYGEAGQMYTESTPLAGRHPYDVSKSCADLISQSYATTFGTPLAITRCGNLFGGGDTNWNRLVPGTVRSALRGERPVIRSDGQSIRDYIYVDDAAAAYLMLAERVVNDSAVHGMAFNFSNETPVTVLQLTQEILDASGSTVEPKVEANASNEILHQLLDASLARERLGWGGGRERGLAVAATVDWYRSYLAEESLSPAP